MEKFKNTVGKLSLHPSTRFERRTFRRRLRHFRRANWLSQDFVNPCRMKSNMSAIFKQRDGAGYDSASYGTHFTELESCSHSWNVLWLSSVQTSCDKILVMCRHFPMQFSHNYWLINDAVPYSIETDGEVIVSGE